MLPVRDLSRLHKAEAISLVPAVRWAGIHLPRILRHLLRRPVNMARMRRYYVYKINNGGMADLNKLFDSIVAGKLESAVEVTEQILKEDLDIQLIINNYMIKAMEEIGDRFQRQQAYVPELLMAARAMKGSLELLKPHLKGEKTDTIGKIVIGTVFGDLHDIGKNLVASMFEGCGFEVVNMGVNISADKFVETVKIEKPDILCLSALLTTTMSYMKVVMDALEKEGLRDQVKVMVGGAPVNELFANQIGADGYSGNANAAVIKAKELLCIA